MKRIRLLILLGVVAVALPFGALHAGAASKPKPASTTPMNYVEIEPNAAFDDAGFTLHVELKVRCAGTGIVQVQVDQYPPETEFETHGFGTDTVTCDGQTHEEGVTITGIKFDAGRAFATATLTATTGTDKDARWIDIRVV
jgi:hypothetical protein